MEIEKITILQLIMLLFNQHQDKMELEFTFNKGDKKYKATLSLLVEELGE